MNAVARRVEAFGELVLPGRELKVRRRAEPHSPVTTGRTGPSPDSLTFQCAKADPLAQHLVVQPFHFEPVTTEDPDPATAGSRAIREDPVIRPPPRHGRGDCEGA